jgi:hypothetical protein
MVLKPTLLLMKHHRKLQQSRPLRLKDPHVGIRHQHWNLLLRNHQQSSLHLEGAEGQNQPPPNRLKILLRLSSPLVAGR